MNSGMLWFDNDPKTELMIKVQRAAAYYQSKYGRTPTLCFVHPSMLAAVIQTDVGNKAIKLGQVEIRSNKAVLPNHFWIGVNGNGTA